MAHSQMIFLFIKRYVIKFSLIVLCLSTPSAAMAINAYVLTADIDSGNAIIDTLVGFGIEAQLGVSTSLWDGSQVDLDGIDVVILNSRLEVTPIMPIAGQQALLDFVSSGGGLITTAETGGRMSFFNDYELLIPLIPFDLIGSSSAGGASYSVNTSNTTLNQDLPNNIVFSFQDVPDSNNLDIELFSPIEGATEFYTHNTSLSPRPAGLVGWDFNEGRVLSFANAFRPRELESQNLAILLRNSVTWVSEEIVDEDTVSNDLCIPIRGQTGFALVCF